MKATIELCKTLPFGTRHRPGRAAEDELMDFSIVANLIPSPTNLTKTKAKEKATPTPVIPKFFFQKS
jgi:hypothetical protein